MADKQGTTGPEPPEDTDESITAGLSRLSGFAEGIEARLRPVERRSGWQTALLALVAVVALACGVIAFGNRQVSDAIQSCIDPAGDCYKESRTRTGEVERRILADQATRASRELEVVCDLYDSHGLVRPPECGPDLPDR